MVKRKIIIDCDPGVDDAVAILVAFASSEIEVMGITTVAGNVPLESTTRNALRICQLAGRTDVPIHAGSQHGIFPTPPRTYSVHGGDGLGDVLLAEATNAIQPEHAVDFIIRTVMTFPGEITLCPIGPMTNIALALLKEPAITSKIQKIVFMGGAAFCPGNTTPAAEFNIWFDPHAAQIVLDSGIPLVMLGLDVTNKVVMTTDRINTIRAGGKEIGIKAATMMAAYGKCDTCLHDPCVIAYILNPLLFAGVAARVDVDCVSEINRGRTVAAVSERHRAGACASCQVITSVDDEKLFCLLTERLTSF